MQKIVFLQLLSLPDNHIDWAKNSGSSGKLCFMFWTENNPGHNPTGRSPISFFFFLIKGLGVAYYSICQSQYLLRQTINQSNIMLAFELKMVTPLNHLTIYNVLFHYGKFLTQGNHNKVYYLV